MILHAQDLWQINLLITWDRNYFVINFFDAQWFMLCGYFDLFRSLLSSNYQLA